MHANHLIWMQLAAVELYIFAHNFISKNDTHYEKRRFDVKRKNDDIMEYAWPRKLA